MKDSKRKWITVILTVYSLMQLGTIILEIEDLPRCVFGEGWEDFRNFLYRIFLLIFFTLVALYVEELVKFWRMLEIGKRKKSVLLVLVILIFTCFLYYRQQLSAKTLGGAVAAWAVIKSFAYFYYDSGGRQSRVKQLTMENIEQEYRKDVVYIPKLLEAVESKELRERTSHMLYTYMIGAKKYKRRYYFLTGLSVFFPAAITAFTNLKLGNDIYIQIVISLCSMAMVVLTGISGSIKARESWIRYRGYCEQVKKELDCYRLKIQPYNSGDREQHLVQNLENIYANERKEWEQMRVGI